MIKFTDIRSYVGSQAYLCPNECLHSLRAALDAAPNKEPITGGAIASGGEVPLSVVLPRLRGVLQIVDHNYGSLFYTCVKILMLKHKTNAEIDTLTGSETAMRAFAESTRGENPLSQFFKDGLPVPCESSPWTRLGAFWRSEIPYDLRDAARTRLHQIELIHGDLRDLNRDLDILYTSNAFGHTPHDRGRDDFRTGTMALVKMGGVILTTYASPGYGLQVEEDFTEAANIHEQCTHGCSWIAYLYQRKVSRPIVTERFRYVVEDKMSKLKQVIPQGPGWPPYVTTWRPKFPKKNVRSYASRSL